jgi:peptidoglycan hydrolase-like protein with peptidoglycan-binding domain
LGKREYKALRAILEHRAKLVSKAKPESKVLQVWLDRLGYKVRLVFKVTQGCKVPRDRLGHKVKPAHKEIQEFKAKPGQREQRAFKEFRGKREFKEFKVSRG